MTTWWLDSAPTVPTDEQRKRIDEGMRQCVKDMAREAKAHQAKILSGEIPHPLEGLGEMVAAANRAPKHKRGVQYNRSRRTLADEDYLLEGN